MGQMIELTAADGHQLGAYRAGTATGRGLVVIQEIFGVNHHIRAVCDQFAEQGYAVVAPALFDRAEPGVELGYAEEDVARGIELRKQVAEEGTMQDVAAAAASLGGMPLGIVGYCWGGTVAWWGATRSQAFKAASGWYGGGIAATRTEQPGCPVQLHFGAEDHGIPQTDVEAIREAQPGVEVFVYPGAGHGFGCTERPSFDETARDNALARTLELFAQHVR